MTETTPAPGTAEAAAATERLAAWVIASLNGTAAVLLGTGYVLIRRRRIAAHRTCMIAAFAASSPRGKVGRA